MWGDATLLCITHDVGETMNFERVLVVQGGKIVEDDAPHSLAARADSRYSQLLQAEDAVRAGLWANDEWRHVRMDDGRVIETRGRTNLSAGAQMETRVTVLADERRRRA